MYKIGQQTKPYKIRTNSISEKHIQMARSIWKTIKLLIIRKIQMKTTMR